MNVRAPLSALILLGVCTASATVLAQPAETQPPPLPPTDSSTSTSAMPPPAASPPPPAPATAVSSLRVESSSTTIKFGLLVQPQYEAAGSVTADSMSQNLFLRRARVLLGGTLFGMFDYFLDTDFPNLFKSGAVPAAGTATYVKGTPSFLQDVFLTYKPMADLIKVDVGYMLPPLSHNALQGAGTLYGWDYFGYAFQHSTGGYGGAANTFGSSANPIGRDLGVQARGLVVDGHLEYRIGVFQGLRNAPSATEVGARNFFRLAGRVQVNLFDAESGFFYAGTYFGSKKIVSLGGSFDFQDNYAYFAGDALVDLPLGPGVLTGQLNLAHWNNGTIGGAATLPFAQTAISAEAGFTLTAIQVSPIVRFEELVAAGAPPNENRFSIGAAYWPYLHNSNLKLFYTRTTRQNAPHGANQINLQWQLYFF
jgi:hypothetical protein